MQTWMAQVRMKADQFSELTFDSFAAVNQPAIVKEEICHFSVRIQRQLTNFHLWSSAHYGCYSKHLQVKHIRWCLLCSCKTTEISTDKRWITGTLLGCQRASRTPFTSTLTGAKHQWLGLPTINDLLQEDQNAFSVFRVTTDLQQRLPLTFHSHELRPTYILANQYKKIPHRNRNSNNGGYRLNESHSRAQTTGKWRRCVHTKLCGSYYYKTVQF